MVLFSEPGARWRAVAYGPLLCAGMLLIEWVFGSTLHGFALGFCAVAIGGFTVLQVIAGRTHARVELTDSTLRQGVETLPLADIAEVLAPDDDDVAQARPLGALTGVPRRRRGIGLRLVDGRIVRAWAIDHAGLRAALTGALAGSRE
ncbi:membrane protein [Nocardia neocaledoniensis NBRC 108232]|uniref:DUF3093 family protein n=1 Tax=Nocardia neocaledoniensis TaxID=236511 RepID=A0A317NF42_9NOCA|nr:hypothetical protein [Nocardia neocaledoniensis]PWV73640.1 hypothetical protein DFR69_107267 [Nocardia neocaledoniensis]GEM33462.1 membrane protein [Nocardia neocaledoniensis NBRC 108232]